MNPCPCGCFGDSERECRCSLVQVQRYHVRISAPLLDRIDIHLEVPAVQYNEPSQQAPGESSSDIRQRVEHARERQLQRFGKGSKVRCNARMSSRRLKTHCSLDDAGEGMLRMATNDLNLSARACDRILKVARTIADLADSGHIEAERISEASQYRTLDRNLWA